MKVSILQRGWQSVDQGFDSFLEDYLETWASTRYMRGCQVRGKGVDCVRFVAAVLDHISGRRTSVRTLPQDAAFHDPAGARAAVRDMLRLYEPYDAIRDPDAPIQPGDILVVGPTGGGPGHAIIAGGRKNTLWQSDIGTGVARGGLGLVDNYQVLHRIYRVSNLIELWHQSQSA